MHELERIEQALANNDLDPALFERCAQDLLSETYPGLSPIPGGTDWGRDADAHDGSGGPPPRLMVTKSRDYSDIRANMVGGLESLKQHKVPFNRVVIANPAKLSETQRSKLRKEAAKHGARLDAVYDRGFFASRLRRDGEWRRRLLGLSGDPITVSRVPWRLAESPWSQLPFEGRDGVLDRINDGTGDVILTGKPGVGKTRLLSELPDVVFVDPDAAEDRLADDIRWIGPGLIVIDDVGQAAEQARFIQLLRRQEADWLKIRLVVVCWPDEVESVRDLVPGAEEIELDLLERPEVDTIIRAMGITGVIARQEILDQAEGRAGWAVALADLLLRSGWDDLVTGKALLGQVDGYLRRSQLSVSARDLLAVVAALHRIGEQDLTTLAKTVGVTRPDAGRLLRIVAQGGLLDVEQRRTASGALRQYSVRPPMLASAVATEHYLLGDVPLGDIEELLEAWTDRRVDIVETVCVAAQLGSDRAVAIVDGLVDRVLSDDLAPERVRRVHETYLLIDARCASRVIGWLRQEFERIDDDGKRDGHGLRPMVEFAYLAARRYLDREAVFLMLDIALYDYRATNPNPEHPLRKLGDFCTHVHPDMPVTADQRVLVASVLEEFIASNPDDLHWRVWGAVVGSVLTPHVRGTFSAPEDVHRFSIIESIVTPEHARVIHEQLWPTICDQLSSAPTTILAELVSVIHEWLAVGGGYDHPFGQDHPEDAIAAADAVGRSMLGDLLKICEDHPGLTARVVGTAEMFDIEISAELIAEVEASPFFRDFDRRVDWQAAIETLRADIAMAVEIWAREPANEVVARLLNLRAEIQTAGRGWPDRIWMACQSLAEQIEEPVPWVQAALQGGLFAGAGPFLERLISVRPAGFESVIQECLDDASARGHALAALLSNPPDDGQLSLAVSRLTAADFELLDMLMLRGQLSPEVQIRILQQAPHGARGAFAIALAGRTDDPAESIGDELLESFLAAVLEIRPEELNRNADHQLLALLGLLAKAYPDTAEDLVRRRLEEAGPGGLFNALGYDVWRALHVLPRANRTALLQAFPESQIRWFLFEHLVGPDADWLEELLDQGVITPEEALGASGFHGRIPIDRMATLLVPRGVDPAHIAGLAFSGSWTGEESERYQRLIEQFEAFSESEDESISAVGQAGVEILTQARDEAAERERQRRIRGEP